MMWRVGVMLVLTWMGGMAWSANAQKEHKQLCKEIENTLSRYCVGTIYAERGRVKDVRCRGEILKLEEQAVLEAVNTIRTTILSEVKLSQGLTLSMGPGDVAGYYFVRLEGVEVVRKRFDGRHFNKETVDRIDLLFREEEAAEQCLDQMRRLARS